MLHADDIAAIRDKYGIRDGSWHRICAQSNAAQIVATRNGHLYRRDSDGKVWQHNSLLNWSLLDQCADTAQIDATSYNLDQRHYNGEVFRWTGKWVSIDVGDGNVQIASARNSKKLYQRHKNGQVWQYTSGSSWMWLDENSSTVEITANGSTVFLRHDNGAVYRYHGKPGDWSEVCGVSNTTRIVGD